MHSSENYSYSTIHLKAKFLGRKKIAPQIFQKRLVLKNKEVLIFHSDIPALCDAVSIHHLLVLPHSERISAQQTRLPFLFFLFFLCFFVFSFATFCCWLFFFTLIEYLPSRQGGLSFLFLVSLCFCMLPFIFCFLTLKQDRQGYIFLVYMLKMAFLVVFLDLLWSVWIFKLKIIYFRWCNI